MSGYDFSSWNEAYAGTPPWEIGGPQPEIARILDAGGIRGEVIDVGCGTGENALLIASRGHLVVGVDASQAAIARAKEKAAERGVPATFLVHDALELGALRYRFSTAIDSGLFHVLDDAARRRYEASLATALGPGATLHLLCFSDAEPPGPGPRRVSEWEIRDVFRPNFVLTAIRPGLFESLMHPGGAKAWVATLTRN